MTDLKIKFLIILFLASGINAQEPYFLMNFSDKLEVNIKESRNAVTIYYDYDLIRLRCGNEKVPTPVAITDAIKEFLTKNDIPANIIFVSPTAFTGSDRKEFCKLLIENKIENIMQFSFLPMADLDFILKPVSIAPAGYIPADHPLCQEKMKIGLLSTVMIAPFSGDELMESYAGVKQLFEEMTVVFGTFKKGFTATEEPKEYDLSTNGKIIPYLPKDIKSAPIYIYEMEEYVLYGKPKGMINKLAYKVQKNRNKTVHSDNEHMRSIYAQYDLVFYYYSYSKPVPKNLKSGYILSFIDCYYDISNLQTGLANENQESESYIDVKILAEFDRISNKGCQSECCWHDPPAFRYYYFKDVVSGEIYLINYDIKELDFGSGDKSVLDKSLKTFLNLVIA